MNKSKYIGTRWLFACAALSIFVSPARADHESTQASADVLEAVTVFGESLFSDTTQVSPTSTITAEELEATNITTTEDAIAYEPGLVVRRRFIGDPNGVIGLRGSNEFQGTRSLVFVDGQPLHYHLQTRFSGAPRWSLVSPSEISQAEVVYGPFSAEYSGNAIGGVVNITTRTPSEKKTIIDASFFSQDFESLETSDQFNGGKVFISHENRVGNLDYFVSYNHLENNSQPLDQFFTTGRPGEGTEAVSGFINGVNARGEPVVLYGDSGSEEATTDLLKLKLGYDFGRFRLRTSIAYEERERDSSDQNNFLRDANGDAIFGNFTLAGAPNISYATSSFGSSAFQARQQERDSLLIGVGLSGQLANDWEFDTFYSKFDILDDIEVRTGANQGDPNFAAVNARFGGRLTSFDNTGWDIFDFKIGTQSLAGDPSARLSLGYHFDSYSLGINPFRFNAVSGEVGTSRGASGGEAQTQALFAQFGYQFGEEWDVSVGLRYEDWESEDSFASDAQVGPRSENGFSPKLSIARFFAGEQSLRYSVARALRFPIVEELFRNESSGARQFDGNADLSPEDGVHHNLSWEKLIRNGLVRVNVFYEEVDQTIFNFSATNANGQSITTALPVDEVTTRGLELVYNQKSLFDTNIDLRFNATFVDAEISKNRLNPNIVGRQFPRIPKSRVNALLTYHYSPTINISGGARYSSNSFNELDNSDTAQNVFGARDDYLFINLKANWQASDNVHFGVGMENVFNEEAYVFHPWPFRTVFVNGRYSF